MHIIFHIPKHIDRTDASASEIRPSRLIRTFKELGYVVDVVEGYGRERKAQISAIKKKIRDGVKYDFLYSESSTMPTLLTERHHLPTYPCLDFSFLRFCKKNAIPIGLFYRDIYWNFVNKSADWKQCVARPFYLYDLKMYRRLLDVLFLPTTDMLQYIPFRFDRAVEELPSGCPFQPLKHESAGQVLEIFYVGGLGGDYDLRYLVQAVAKTEGVHLTLCCRQSDWQTVATDYEPLLNDRITVVHKKGDELLELYVRADLFAMVFTPSEYRRFAAPFKLFETVGYGVPVLATANTWAGRYVEKNKIGACCDNDVDSLCGSLEELLANREILEVFRTNIVKVAQENTWQARCEQIKNTLTYLNADRK